MSQQQKEYSQEIYHRIYRLAKRNIKPQLIAAALGLPVEAVQNIVNRLFNATDAYEIEEETVVEGEESSSPPFLDIMLVPRSRYAILDISGMAVSETEERLSAQLENLLMSTWKAIALKVSDIQNVDEKGVQAILSFHAKFTHKGRYTALLDPSPEVERAIEEFELGNRIPIFGTERSFEESAYEPEALRKDRK